MSPTPEVLFICVHNAGRSQMAAALLGQRSAGRVRARSAGTAPAPAVNPAVVTVMAELGIDLTHERPKPLTDEAARSAHVVITMGCGDVCPIYPHIHYLTWDLDDPSGKTPEQIRPIRDTIDARVRTLLHRLGLAMRLGFLEHERATVDTTEVARGPGAGRSVPEVSI